MDIANQMFHTATTDGNATFCGREDAVTARHAAAGVDATEDAGEGYPSWSRFGMWGYRFPDTAATLRRHALKKGRAAYAETNGRSTGITYGASPA